MAKWCKYYGFMALYLDCLDCDDKPCRGICVKKNKEHKIVVGIDQSYKDTGISISMDGKIKTITHCFTADLKSNTDKRNKLQNRLKEVFYKVSQINNRLNEKEASSVLVVIERIRLRSEGFLNIDYIKSIGALNAMIVDTASSFGFEVFSADTRNWKSCVVGTSKPEQNKYGIDAKKWPTIKWVISKGFEESIKEEVSKRKSKGVIEKNGERYTYNDNAADSAAISLSPFFGVNLKKEH